MNRHSVFFVCLAVAAVVSAFGGCTGCDKPTNQVGQGGAGASAGGGYWVLGDPGKPGIPLKLGGNIPFAQGMTKRVPIVGASYAMDANHCAGVGGGAGVGGTAGALTGGSGGVAMGGAGGTGGSGGNVFDQCPSQYVAADPTMDLSKIGQTDAAIYVASPPLFQPVGTNWGDCPTEMEPISFGALYKGDCSGITMKIDIFTSADLPAFFGAASNVLPVNTDVVMGGTLKGPVRMVSGIAVSTAASGDSVFAATNVWHEIVSATPDVQNPGQWIRTDTDVGTQGVSALMSLPGGKILFATNRTFPYASLLAARSVSDNPNPADVLAQDQPIFLKTLDPLTGVIADFASLDGLSRVIPEYCGRATVDQDGNPLTCYFAGSANILALAQNGNILFSDRLDGKVYEISIDGLTATLLFTVPDDVAVTGLTQAPNGIIYLVASPTSDFNGTYVTAPPRILYWNAGTSTFIEWAQLVDPAYTELLTMLLKTNVLERWYGKDSGFLGAGLFINLAHDSQGNLIVTATVTGTTTAYPVIPTPPPGTGGAGGTGGVAGAPPTGGSGGSTPTGGSSPTGGTGGTITTSS